jgi:hypothetical protein
MVLVGEIRKLLFFDKPIITVKEARKLLGKDFRYLTDSQVENLIELLNIIASDEITDKVPN